MDVKLKKSNFYKVINCKQIKFENLIKKNKLKMKKIICFENCYFDRQFLLNKKLPNQIKQIKFTNSDIS